MLGVCSPNQFLFNIWSRLRTLKKQWHAIHDLIYGPNASDFGWDPLNKCVEAEVAVWEEYVKV